MQDLLHNKIEVRRMISPVSVSDNTAQVSQIIDLQGYDACEIVVATGSLADADATFTALLEDGDAANLSDNAAVASTARLGSLPSFVFSDDDKVFKVGYLGAKRYIRLTITPAANASAALFSAVAILGAAMKQPTP